MSESKAPGPAMVIVPIVAFTLLLAFISYILLISPVYYYVCIFFGIYLIKECKDRLTNSKKQNTENEMFCKKSQEKFSSVCIVGAGFSGLCMGIKLKKAGIPFIILEKGCHIGGTWYANKYPGCRCDVWSILYQVS